MSDIQQASGAPTGSGVAADRWRTRVLDYIDDHAGEVVSCLRDLVRVPSISGSDEENTVQQSLADAFGHIGMEVDRWQIPLEATLSAPGFPGVEVERDEAWGLVARLPGRHGRGSFMLNAHVDVVPPGDIGAWAGRDPFSAALDDGLVHGRGACDMKGGLVAAQWAARAIAVSGVPLQGDLLVACVQGEEDGGLGTFAMLDRGWRASSCVIPEPTSLDLAPGNAGSLTFRLRVHGMATHASRRTSGISAVEKFVPVFAALRRLESTRNAVSDPLMARWDIPFPIEVGTVHAGDWASSVPDQLVAEGRYGVAFGEDVHDARAAFASAVASACADDAWLRNHPVDVEWWGGQFEPGLTDLDADVVSSVRTAHAAVSGHVQQTWGAPYGSDLRLMTNIGGVPTVHYGPGDARLAHGPREAVSTDEVLTAARALALIALDQCGIA